MPDQGEIKNREQKREKQKKIENWKRERDEGEAIKEKRKRKRKGAFGQGGTPFRESGPLRSSADSAESEAKSQNTDNSTVWS